MASPAAPSPSAPAAAGPGQDAAAALPVELAPAPESGNPDKEQRLAKPIKPIPRLPGVIPDDEPFPSAPRRASPSPTTSPGERPRGPDGKFIAADAASTSASTSATPAPPSQEPGDHTLEPTKAEEPPPSKFKFAGEEFDSQEVAEQNFKSLRGQFKPIQQLAREVGGLDKIAPMFNRAAESARGWKAEHDRISAELAQYRSGQAPAATDPAEPQEAQPDVDWELYAEIKKVATEAGEPWKAEKWLQSEVQRVQNARIEALLDERLAPVREAEARAAVTSQTEAIFGSLAEYVNSDGTPGFPELRDEASAFEVGRTWAGMGLPSEVALTPQGAVLAVALYRMMNGSQVKPVAVSPGAAPSAPPPPQTAAAASLSDGRTPVIAPGSPSMDPVSAEGARILQGLRAAHKQTRPNLGFEF